MSDADPLTICAARDPTVAQRARWILVAFVVTFVAARCVVLLVMTRRIPDLFLHVGGTHVHHLNLGIFLLSGVGAYLILMRPADLRRSATVYGIGLALTFDEFGMWLHMGGSYWQRASFDAVVVIAGGFALIWSAPTIRSFRPRHWWTGAAVATLVLVFGVLLADSVRYVGHRLGPSLERTEMGGPH